MSHSRIFQVSEKPISEEEYFDESRYYDCFVGEVADYVSDETDREEDIDRLKRSLEGIVEIDGDKLTIVNKKAYFEERFKRWTEALKDLSGATIEDFMGESTGIGASEASYFPALCKGSRLVAWKMRELNGAYDEMFGFYVDDEECGIRSLESFLRGTSNGDVFYLGATIDYHY